MSDGKAKYIDAAIGQLRKEGGFNPLTIAEADREYESAPDMPLAQEVKDSIIDRVLGEQSFRNLWPTNSASAEPNPSRNSVASEFACLNRNRGHDEAKEALLEKLRRDALSEDVDCDGSGLEDHIQTKKES